MDRWQLYDVLRIVRRKAPMQLRKTIEADGLCQLDPTTRSPSLVPNR